MALPCIDDTCSIVANINTETRHLTLSARTATSGGLYCVDDEGLAINLIGDPEPEGVSDQGFAKIRLTPGGELWIAPEKARNHTFQSDPVSIPQSTVNTSSNAWSNEAIGGANAITDATKTITNPFSVPALMIIRADFRLGYSVPDPGSTGPDAILAQDGTVWAPHAANIQYQLLGGPGGDVEQITGYYAPGGLIRRTSTPANRRIWTDKTIIKLLPAGETWTLVGRARHRSDPSFVDARRNDVAGSTPSTDFSDRGFMCSGNVLLLPMGLDTF